MPTLIKIPVSCCTLVLSAQMHQSNVKRRQRGLIKLQHQVEEKKEENRSLDGQLVEQQVVVLERQAVEKLAGQCRGGGESYHTVMHTRTHIILI